MSRFIKWQLLFTLFPLLIYTQDNETCIDCHEEKDMQVVRYCVPLSSTVIEDDLVGTSHESFDCIDCHSDMEGIDEFPHPARLELPD